MDSAGVTGDRVGSEGHPSGLGRDHDLNHNRERRISLGVTALGAVAQRRGYIAMPNIPEPYAPARPHRSY